MEFEPGARTGFAFFGMQDELSRMFGRKVDLNLWAYVIMPEHVHLLIMPRQADYQMSTLLASIKRPVAFQARRIIGTEEPHFWQPGGGYDRNLIEPLTVHHEIEYIHANPVRRGLCDHPADYRYSSAGFWSGANAVPITMDKSLPDVPIT